MAAAQAQPIAPIDDEDPLADLVRELIVMLDYEIGRRWMSMALRLHLEDIEILLGERGTAAGVP